MVNFLNTNKSDVIILIHYMTLVILEIERSVDWVDLKE